MLKWLFMHPVCMWVCLYMKGVCMHIVMLYKLIVCVALSILCMHIIIIKLLYSIICVNRTNNYYSNYLARNI